MDESLNERINNLRKQSRCLLAQVDENSKKVKDEIKRLCSQSLENSRNLIGEAHPSYKKNTKTWKLRNDSSGVGGTLRSDCFHNSPNKTVASMPNTSTAKRILVSSKKHSENPHCLESTQRRPVKECYCNFEIKKAQLKPTKTQRKLHSPCKRCKSYTYSPAIVVQENVEKSALSSPISCETLRRVQKIDYAPKSQFLRNVRSRVSLLQTAAAGDCPDSCSRSQYYHEFMAKKNVHNVDPMRQLKAEYSNSGAENVEKSSKGVQVSLRKHSRPKTTIKRTLSSKKSVPDVKKAKSSSNITTKSKKSVPSKSCQCCHKHKPEHSKTVLERENNIDSEEYQDTVCVNKPQKDSNREYLTDKEMRELNKFREQHYFDTHGSSHTLVSSKSSGSLEQYLLNDRLFPEPVRRLHKKDLVVTIPTCAILQRKRIHYFPRYIVRQEKNNLNTNFKKKRCQTCPLTGHSIDLGITKIRPPLNSLALKYQKRLP